MRRIFSEAFTAAEHHDSTVSRTKMPAALTRDVGGSTEPLEFTGDGDR
jgi:hypothetical protein